MIIDIDKLVKNITLTFPNVKVELKSEKGFNEIKVIGENNNISYFYPNDLAWFVKLYPNQEDYQSYLFETIENKLLI